MRRFLFRATESELGARPTSVGGTAAQAGKRAAVPGNNAMRNDECYFRCPTTEREEDLSYLREKYFERGFGFDWPAAVDQLGVD